MEAMHPEETSASPAAGSRVAVVGLGYVGLPLAVAFARRHDTVGFDVDGRRVAELLAGRDRTGEVSPEALRAAAVRLRLSSDPGALADRDALVVCVPTPVDASKTPDLSALREASRTVGRHMRRGADIVYEATVYPGVTEEVCVPELEAASGLRLNEGFFVGYSPERANPGDREHPVTAIRKITSGSTPEAARRIDALYASVIDAGTYPAPSIRVAEAAKIVENVQRDVNIALMNELSVIFERLGIDTPEVLAAAATKWNFLPFHPGLVGGHCIGVDPYYLAYMAQSDGIHPEVIASGRRINEAMGARLAARVVKLMTARGIAASGARVLVLGLTFKENCPDIRNTRVPDIVRELGSYGCRCDVADPLADPAEAEAAYGIRLVADPPRGAYDAIVLAVAHAAWRALPAAAVHAYGRPAGHVFFDALGVFPKADSDGRL